LKKGTRARLKAVVRSFFSSVYPFAAIEIVRVRGRAENGKTREGDRGEEITQNLDTLFLLVLLFASSRFKTSATLLIVSHGYL